MRYSSSSARASPSRHRSSCRVIVIGSLVMTPRKRKGCPNYPRSDANDQQHEAPAEGRQGFAGHGAGFQQDFRKTSEGDPDRRHIGRERYVPADLEEGSRMHHADTHAGTEVCAGLRVTSTDIITPDAADEVWPHDGKAKWRINESC